MTKQEIINFEQAANGATITLVKEGLFWRAYEQSAYLFTKLFWPDLKVNGGFVKAAGQEVYYVGFPDASLQGKVLDKLPEVPGSRLLERRDNMVVITGVPAIDGFEAWKQSYVLLRNQANEQMQPFYGKLPLYKAVYDFFQEMVNLTRHFPKDLQYTLGDKIINHALEMNQWLYRTLHLPKTSDDYAGMKNRSIERIEELLETVRFLLRTSFDMKLYNVERFAGVSARVDSIGKQLAGWKKTH
ncbi:MAG: four helix bundle protein [Prevotellaceae bacterium]|nr:four helix bundle protein [Prevotellaceae bacterium]